jgi:hypothetical protein
LQIQRYNAGGIKVLVAATYGRGVWRKVFQLNQAGAAGGEATNNQQFSFTKVFDTSPGDQITQIAINWNDRTPIDYTSGQAVYANGVWTIKGTHTHTEAGPYDVLLTVTSSNDGVLHGDSFVSISDAGLAASATSFNGAAGQSTGSVAVATFSDADTLSNATDYLATIVWGDGTSSKGTVTGSGGNFTVLGSHTYGDAGVFAVGVIVADLEGSTASTTSSANIAGPVIAQTVPVNATEAAPTGTVPVATFTAAGGGPFTAAINWGDGHTSAGTVNALGGSAYNVTGSNTYWAAGSFPLSVTILNAGVTAALVNEAVPVGDAPLTAVGLNLKPTQGVALTNAVVARFSDANARGAPPDYTATIDWGDGSATEAGPDSGTVLADGSGFVVVGNHTYAQSGSYVVSISIADAGGSYADVTGTANVAAAAPVMTGIGPNWGNPAGGTTVLISGTNLYGATALNFGNLAATAFSVNADGSITTVAPAGTAGTVDVTVTTAAGTSSTSGVDQFTYVNAAPTVTGLSASSGASGGNDTITITGTNFAGGANVLFGNTPATSLMITSPTTISAVCLPRRPEPWTSRSLHPMARRPPAALTGTTISAPARRSPAWTRRPAPLQAATLFG